MTNEQKLRELVESAGFCILQKSEMNPMLACVEASRLLLDKSYHYVECDAPFGSCTCGYSTLKAALAAFDAMQIGEG